MNIFKVNGRMNLLALIISIIVAEGTGFLSGFLVMPDLNIYSSLKKPTFSPPGLIFPIVWGILFLLMAIAAYRIWLRWRMGENIRKAIILYIIQLALNLLWTFVFFKFKLYGLAFIELVFLLIFILLTTFEFFRIDKAAGFLMIPYILWISFAGVLNFAIWLLNEA